MPDLLIVESPSKAKTLKKYLGKNVDIVASYGHVRDLIPKSGAVDTEQNFAMHYELIDRNSKHVSTIVNASKRADTIYLATDPDREGEAIAWHIQEILQTHPVLRSKRIMRVVFYEITPLAIQRAMTNPREILMPLVNAQQARRALDYLVGFNLSPLLWKKIRRGLSAGRVQSPALRLIVERELERENFVVQEHWSVHLDTQKQEQAFSAKLIAWQKNKVEQFTFTQDPSDVVTQLTLMSNGKVRVSHLEKKQRTRHPSPPFTTSTLQQQAVNRLGFTTTRTMRVAQQLYEGIALANGTVGLITYMRTDSFHLADEAVADIRHYIAQHFEPAYLPQAPIRYKTKSKNAQEAHEAIRPTDIQRTPTSLRAYLSDEQFKLYEMIWQRTIACQMTSATFDLLSVDLTAGEDIGIFRATGQTKTFAGFTTIYEENHEDTKQEIDKQLPALKLNEVLPILDIRGEQHFTEPPPRYSEASLVKALEEYGIGRPSTYASIISTIQEREYVTLDKKRFIPSEIGRIVSLFLTEHFTRYVDYDFTATLENKLDSVARGEREWIPVLQDFWKSFNQNLHDKADIARPTQAVLDEACPECGLPLQRQLSRYGTFISCTGYKNTPPCHYKRNLDTADETPSQPIHLGNTEQEQSVWLCKGPYGYYVQLGTKEQDSRVKPKRISLPKDITPETVTLDIAQQLLALPRQLGTHPDTGKPIVASIGRFGPYIQHDGSFKSIPKTHNVLNLTLHDAISLLAQGNSSGVLRALGTNPDGHTVNLCKGRYGHYVSCQNIRASVPKQVDIDAVELEQALAWLSAKANAPATSSKRGRKPSMRKSKRG